MPDYQALEAYQPLELSEQQAQLFETHETLASALEAASAQRELAEKTYIADKKRLIHDFLSTNKDALNELARTVADLPETQHAHTLGGTQCI